MRFSDAECGFKIQRPLTLPENSVPRVEDAVYPHLSVAWIVNGISEFIHMSDTSLTTIPDFHALIAVAGDRDSCGGRLCSVQSLGPAPSVVVGAIPRSIS